MKTHARSHHLGQLACLLVAALVAPPYQLSAQTDVRVEAGAKYGASSLQNFLLGHGYRDLWTTPIVVPQLELSAFAGGLTPVKTGGRNQTRTLHLLGANGRTYVFRSVDKFAGRPLPPDLRNTLIESVLQDGTAALHPGASLPLPPLLAAAGLLHATPRLYVMPDDERLGEFRADFANILGQLEEKPDDGAEGAAGFGGAAKIADVEEMIELLRESARNRVDEREWITARLIDFLVGDTDRGPDQWRFAGFAVGDSCYVWRPIPRDRDLAFARAGGLVPRLFAPLLHDKLPRFDSDLNVAPLVITARRIDRVFTGQSTRAVFDSAAQLLKHEITDDVINAALARLPAEYQSLRGAEMAAALRSRRDRLAASAAAWYELLAGEVDVHGTDHDDVVVVDRTLDGSIIVTMSDGRDRPYYARRFIPSETEEVRVYLYDGADRALVRGETRGEIHVRVIGGAGDDTLMDSTHARWRGTHTVFYDDSGTNAIAAGAHTRVDDRTFVPPAAADEWMDRRLGATRHRDWGGATSPAFLMDYSEGAEIVIGSGLQRARYGFRQVPYDWHARVLLLYAVGAGKPGAQFDAKKYLENSRWLAGLHVRATQFDATRFYGYGNDTPDEQELALVMRDEIAIEPAMTWLRDDHKFASFSLIARYTDPRPQAGSPLERTMPDATSSITQLGVRFNGVLDNAGRAHRVHGFAFEVDARALTDPTDIAPYARIAGEVRAYAAGAIALRAGGSKTFGPVPFIDAAYIGGSATLRGYRYERFAGDAALYGGLEVRVPIARMTLVTHGQLRAIGFADAGRVYVDGESRGNWHSGVGFGLAFTTLERTISVTYGHGEHGRVYITTGMPF